MTKMKDKVSKQEIYNSDLLPCKQDKTIQNIIYKISFFLKDNKTHFDVIFN